MTALEPDERQRHLPAGRKAQLAAYVSEAGQVTVGELAERFGVSSDTIRRDLDQLSGDGVLVRTYGGAVSQSTMSPVDSTLDVRLKLQQDEKDAIAALAVGLIEDGFTIMLNGGTTTLAVARALRNHRDLTVATNSLPIPPAIPESALRGVYLVGGAVRLLTQTTVGSVSFRTAGGNELQVSCDLALIAVGAVSADAGYTTSNLAEAEMMREMCARSARVAILADSSKFGRRLFAQISALGQADYLITDAPPPADLREALEAAGVEILTPQSLSR
ncbi:DeoR/GlpR family DNA-binding transcription regulator [Kineosporia succinea]|uniref:Lactose phosphotransferase system repressor n=1 Tax=Kineosporia succinea TaxID=84632 RepID=A0ABT9PDD0_9ACTN|nr:DeoR/GlpR family DNA-binding transcription regulator [Kineosporia succinea]MDP9829985.1 DeoR family glycerol-3-phosphate regulon repressor/DeoR family fructose operon transcriptional repressor [Kineosporia succinea]